MNIKKHLIHSFIILLIISLIVYKYNNAFASNTTQNKLKEKFFNQCTLLDIDGTECEDPKAVFIFLFNEYLKDITLDSDGNYEFKAKLIDNITIVGIPDDRQKLDKLKKNYETLFGKEVANVENPEYTVSLALGHSICQFYGINEKKLTEIVKNKDKIEQQEITCLPLKKNILKKEILILFNDCIKMMNDNLKEKQNNNEVIPTMPIIPDLIM